MSEHTPGPWRYAEGRPFRGFVVADVAPDERGRTVQIIATVPNVDGAVNSENQANARLIAAAPRMVQALRGVIAAQRAGELSYRSSDGSGYEAMLDVEAAFDLAVGPDWRRE